tara:strand:+ start:1428 stop:2480 length:1053 start_codon:yes stop_codon:yes gene_type:complete
MSPLVISNELDFLEYAHGVLAEDKEFQEIRFEGWPVLNFNIKGKRYNSSLPTKLMEGFVSFQQEVDRAFALIQYRAANRQKLTNDDKEVLELVFKIKEGSTDASSPMADYINGLINQLGALFEDMSSKQKVGLIALIVFCLTGGYAINQFTSMTTKLETERLKAESSEKIEAEKTKQFKELTDNNELTISALKEIVMNEAIQKSPKRGAEVVKVFGEGYKSVVRSASDAEQISIGESTYNKAAIRTISEKPDIIRDVSQDSGAFFIEGIKKKDTYLSISVSNVMTDDTFNIKADTSFLEDDERISLYDAFRDNTEVQLEYQANLQNGDIVNARLIKVLLEDSSSQTASTL